jgi:signal transduction histidine kinase
LKRALAGETMTGPDLWVEMPPPGRSSWSSAKLCPCRDAGGNIIGVIVTLNEVSERHAAEKKLREYSDRLCSLSQQLMQAQELERRRIAHELHDEIGQILTAIQINLEAALSSDGPESVFRLEESVGIVKEAIEQVRDLSLDLRPSVLDDFGLEVAVKWLAERQAQRANFSLQFTADEDGPRLSPELETSCFRIVQEALTNIMRHAQAKNVWLALQRTSDEIQITITDDGVGFDIEAAKTGAASGRNLGLTGMEERASFMNGSLHIVSTPGAGTTIRAYFPVLFAFKETGNDPLEKEENT